MMPSDLPAPPLRFEDLRRTNEHGAEYWSARDLQPLLGYSQWRRFEDAIGRAMTSCEQSGNECGYHFAGAGKPIVGGKGAVQEVSDYHLSRFACYLITQNGDPRKPAIAQAQKYFAIQTRRQALSDAQANWKKRVCSREGAKARRGRAPGGRCGKVAMPGVESSSPRGCSGNRPTVSRDAGVKLAALRAFAPSCEQTFLLPLSQAR